MLPRLLAALLLPGAVIGHARPALAQPATCTATAETLHVAPHRDTAARALWLDARRLQWPAAPVDGRYALYRSARAALIATPGAPVAGADGRIPLAIDDAPLAPRIADRFRHVAAGARLALPALDPATHDTLWRAQLLLVREDDAGRVLEATGVQLAGALDDRFAAAESVPDLGGTIGAAGARFVVWAPTAQRVALCIAPAGRPDGVRLVPMVRDEGTGAWRAQLGGAWRGATYHYLADVVVPGVGLVRNRVTDPWSVALTADSRASVLLSLDDPATRPTGWAGAPRPAPLAAPTDQVVYELHVRDFSAGDVTVRPSWRGRYLAFTEPRSAGMRHLRALAAAGVTDVHLLPVFDLSTVPEIGCVTPPIPVAPPDAEAQQAAVSAARARDCFNWGYDPSHYTVPEGSYATDAAEPATRIREFRAMVQALHAAGLRVGMDVVYNHTYAAGQSPMAVLDRLVPGYYHRLDAEGRITRSTCCENTATEHAMMAKLMIESAATWARHYRIDAFRFDLMGHQPRAAMERLQAAVDRAAGRHISLLGEGWNFGEVADGARFVQAAQRSLGGSGIATFSDRARDALRGGGCCDGRDGLVANQGWLNGLHLAPNAANAGGDRHAALLRAADLVRIGLAGTLADYPLTGADGVRRPAAAFDYAGQPAGYAASPAEVVNYVENHDNLTLFDVNAFRLPAGTSREQRARASLLGIAVTLFSQGVAYLHAGVELLRSKSLDRDSFDSGDWFNRLDWSGRSHGFGAGLPPAHRNADDWPVMRPVLADSTIAPTAREIALVRDATRDLLRIRASSTLFRLRTAADVRARLTFRNTGPAQDPAVIVGHLDGAGYPGARFREVLYLLNTAPASRTVTLAADAGKAWVLHPVHRAPGAADRDAATARVERAAGRFVVPARTAVVFVVE